MKLSRPCLLLVCVVMAALGQPGPPGPGEGPSPPPVALTPGAGPNAANNLAQAIWLYLQGGSSAGGPPGAASGLPPPAPVGPVAPHGAVASTSGGLPPPAPVGSAPGASGSTEGPPWRRSHSRVPAPPVAAEVEATPAVETAAPSGTVVEVPDNTTGPTPKAASKRPLTLDLRHCRVCQETAYQGKGICLNTDCDLHKASKYPQQSRKKHNRGKKRPIWYVHATQNKHGQKWHEDDEEEWNDEGHWTSADPLWKGDRWQDWRDDGGHSASGSSRGRWAWVWVS
ncbi:unnamed protein product [Cladocopium goreaui]|uniref:Uncharacterized protein n=1 Tax=Cladocopium goreaui TaxID=2562237 RepID=A0A9P1GN86_9DINO|nr:unnamed protein product [Cladocopium goreaui]